MNVLDLALVALSMGIALFLGYRAVRQKPSGGCHSSESGKISTRPPTPCASCQSVVRRGKPGAAAR
jgi:hypothetical protein